MSTTMWIIAGSIIGLEVIILIAVIIALGRGGGGSTRTYVETRGYGAPPQDSYGQVPQQPGGYPAQGGYPPQSPAGFPPAGEAPPTWPPQP